MVLAAAFALGVISWRDGRRFASDETLFAPEVAAEPACREALFYLGEAHRARKEWAPAAERYESALASPPNVLAFVDLDATLQNLGVVRLALREFEPARRAFEGALELARDPTERRKIHHDLAVVELEDGQPQKAAELLESESARPDAMPESLLIYAKALDALGRHAEAERVLERAVASGRVAP
jgi:tetratricopeptide (TPR) repeat protein